MEHTQHNKNYLNLKAPGKCLVDQELAHELKPFGKAFGPLPTQAEQNGLRERMVAGMSDKDKSGEHEKKVNAYNRTHNKPPYSKCVF